MLTSLITIASVSVTLNRCPAVADGMQLSLDGGTTAISAGHVYIQDQLVSVPEQTLHQPQCEPVGKKKTNAYTLFVNAQGTCRWECFSPAYALKSNEIAIATLTESPGIPPVARAVSDMDPILVTQAIAVNNKVALPKTINILRSGGILKVVFWGDSITAGTGASTAAHAFPAQTVGMLRGTFPKVRIESKICGVAATNTSARLATAESEVFANDPNLVIVEFLNDFALDEQSLRANYAKIVDLARKHNSELIFVRASSPAPFVYHLKTYGDFHNLAAGKLLQEMNSKQLVGLADVENAFAQSGSNQGIDREILMFDPVHPNDWGHAMYAKALYSLLTHIPTN